MAKYIKLLAFPFLIAVLAYPNFHAHKTTWIYPDEKQPIHASTETFSVTTTVITRKPIVNNLCAWPPPKPTFPEKATVWKPKPKDYSGNSYKGYFYSPIKELNKPVFVSPKSTCSHKYCKPKYYKTVCSCAMPLKLYLHDHRDPKNRNKN